MAGLCPLCLLRLGLEREDDAGQGWIDPGTWACRVLNVIDAEGGETSYLAEQTAPVKRLVVLRQVNVRVAPPEERAPVTERLRALAGFDHPNVARVFGGLTSESGGLFLVTDYAAGTALHTYCARTHVAERDRLRLLLPVVDAVCQMHDLGIVHGGLAPSRVVVTLRWGAPQPVVTGLGAGMMRRPPLKPSADVAALLELLGSLDLAVPPGDVRSARGLADWLRARV